MLMINSFNAGARLMRYEFGEEELFRSRQKQHQQSARGQLSGKARRANRKWVPHAEELAKQIRREDPKVTPPRIAAEINVRWKLADHHPPGQETLVGHIREMIKTGTLARTKDE
jgi:hypothetical protein